jgi:uncharacterized protein YndB with AHSA1/START domain
MPTQPHKEITITRIVDAPRALVFAAWTDPKRLQEWWGPKGFTNPVCEWDARPGGALTIVMRAPDGADYPMKGVFQEVVALERISFTNIALDTAGNTLLEGFTTVTFADEGARTKLTVQTGATGLVAAAPAMLEGMQAGWTQSLEKLDTLLAKNQGK